MKTDVEIQSDIIEELKWEPSVCAAEIGVAVHKGIVTLSGHVKSYVEKMHAELAARRVKDVRAVVEEIAVTLRDKHMRTDLEIAEAAVNALTWNSILADEHIAVRVEQGYITLEGRVDWQYKKDAAAKALSIIVGLKGISNQLVVMPHADPGMILEDIQKALKRRSDLRAAVITVAANGGHITLRGKIENQAEREIVKYAAWSAPGVSSVTDELELA